MGVLSALERKEGRDGTRKLEYSLAGDPVKPRLLATIFLIILLASCATTHQTQDLADERASIATLEAGSIKGKHGPADKRAYSDVKGWHKTKWGMPPSELEQAYQTNLRESCKDEGGRCIYTLQPVELYGTPFSVEFHLAKESKLYRVRVLNKYKKGSQLKLAEQIEAELKEKYGTPQVLNDEREHTEPRITGDGRTITGLNALELQWIFPSTTITYYRSIRKYPTSNATVVHSVISLDYQASDHPRHLDAER